MTMGEHDGQFEHIPFPGRARTFVDGEDLTSEIFDVNAYVAGKMKAFASAVDTELETRIIEHLRGKGWIVDKPQEGMSADDIWWRVRGAVMKELAGLDLDYERRSMLAEDAARELVESINVEMGEAPR